jgi:uncharacterized protein (TIGR02001 family)
MLFIHGSPGVFMRFIPSPLLALALSSACALSPLAAHAEGLSFNVGAESSYDDQGKDFAPSLQGGVDYAFSNGFYVGNWNSTGKFGEALKSTVEVDLYVGYAKALASGLSYDLAVTRYLYPGVKDLNANDVNLDVAYGPATVSYTQAFTSDGFDSGYTLGLTLAHNITDALEASVLVEGDKGVSSLNYELALAYDMGKDLSISGTVNKDKPRLVLGISKGF